MNLPRLALLVWLMNGQLPTLCLGPLVSCAVPPSCGDRFLALKRAALGLVVGLKSRIARMRSPGLTFPLTCLNPWNQGLPAWTCLDFLSSGLLVQANVV